MTTPPENAPGSAAGSPNHLGWHGQWLQAAAECLGVAPRPVSLEELLARGPVVLSFYRGRW